MTEFRNLCIVSSVFCFGTFALLTTYPAILYTLLDLEGSASADVMSRRAGILFLAVGSILWLQRNLTDRSARSGLAMGMCVFMLGFVVLGLAEYARGSVGVGIFGPVAIEAVMGILFLFLAKSEKV